MPIDTKVHDPVVSKPVAGCEKDITFVESLCRRGLAAVDALRQRLAITGLSAERRVLCEGRITRILRALESGPVPVPP